MTPPLFRIGSGFDVHALVAGRALVVGCVTIPYERGLDGHSDADVLLHAVADALLDVEGEAVVEMHGTPLDGPLSPYW